MPSHPPLSMHEHRQDPGFHRMAEGSPVPACRALSDFPPMGGHEVGDGGRAVEVAVTFGLLAAWAVHDLEEVASMPGWARGHVPGLRQRYPHVPEQVWRRLESMHGREFATAVAVR